MGAVVILFCQGCGPDPFLRFIVLAYFSKLLFKIYVISVFYVIEYLRFARKN